MKKSVIIIAIILLIIIIQCAPSLPTKISLIITFNNTIVTANGEVLTSGKAKTFEYGEEVSIEATPDEGYTFVEWTGDLYSEDNPEIIFMYYDMYINAEIISED
jgi:hypothetical protein